MSCHTPILLGGDEPVIIPELHCRFLERSHATGEFRCTVYENRFEMAPWCMTANEAARGGALAWDCPYSTGLTGVKGKRWATDWERESIVEALRTAFVEAGLPAEDNPDSALLLLGSEWTYRLEGNRFRFVKRQFPT